MYPNPRQLRGKGNMKSVGRPGPKNCPHDFDQVPSGLCVSGSPSVQMRAVGPHSGLWKSGELAFVSSCLCPLSTPPRQSPRHWVTVPPPPNTCPQPAGIRRSMRTWTQGACPLCQRRVLHMPAQPRTAGWIHVRFLEEPPAGGPSQAAQSIRRA